MPSMTFVGGRHGEMDQVYRGGGVRFQYPSTWQLTEEAGSGETSITLTGPGTVFWSLTLMDSRPAPEDVVRAAVDTYREEYPDLDVYDAPPSQEDPSIRSVELGFLCLELTNSALLTSFRTGRFTALVLYQATDTELDSARSTLEGITRSLCCEEENP